MRRTFLALRIARPPGGSRPLCPHLVTLSLSYTSAQDADDGTTIELRWWRGSFAPDKAYLELIRQRCIHGVRHNGYECKECPGKGICEHGQYHERCEPCARASGTALVWHVSRTNAAVSAARRCNAAVSGAQVQRDGGQGQLPRRGDRRGA